MRDMETTCEALSSRGMALPTRADLLKRRIDLVRYCDGEAYTRLVYYPFTNPIAVLRSDRMTLDDHFALPEEALAACDELALGGDSMGVDREKAYRSAGLIPRRVAVDTRTAKDFPGSIASERWGGTPASEWKLAMEPTGHSRMGGCIKLTAEGYSGRNKRVLLRCPVLGCQVVFRTAAAFVAHLTQVHEIINKHFFQL